jgi:hypothetical protein
LMKCALAGAAMCSTCWWRAWPLAIMPFAEPGPDQKQALFGALAQLGFRSSCNAPINL